MGRASLRLVSDMPVLEVSVDGVGPSGVMVNGVSTLFNTARRTCDAYLASLDSESRDAQIEWMEWRRCMWDDLSSRLGRVSIIRDRNMFGFHYVFGCAGD